MDLNRAFAINLRRMRRAADTTQKELASICGVTVSYLSQVENGSRNPTLTFVQKLADALGVEPAILLGCADEEPRAFTHNRPADVSFNDYPMMICTREGMHLLPARSKHIAYIKEIVCPLTQGDDKSTFQQNRAR